MEISNKLKNWFYHTVIAIDQLFNAITGGGADETLSSRTFRRAVLHLKPKKRWRILYKVINGIFFDKDHCYKAWQSEINRKQYPVDFETN